jgi:hypothetical protein
VSEGEFLNGFLNGHGTEEYPDGNVYTGDFEDGVKSGRGEFVFTDGSKYTGGFLDDMKHGKGKFLLWNLCIFQFQCFIVFDACSGFL